MYASTSWDDGSVFDPKLAELLVSHGASGTFYVCRSAVERNQRVSDSELRRMSMMPGIELGAHSLTHVDLRRLSYGERAVELAGSKAWLEDVVQKSVRSFCYPMGLHRRSMAKEVLAAGYDSCRTTLGGRTDMRFSPLRMPTTFQFYPHKRHTLVRHAVKEAHARGFLHYASVAPPWPTAPIELLERHLSRSGAEVIHMWGHGWEMEALDLWTDLHRSLELLTDAAAVWLTNTELAEMASR